MKSGPFLRGLGGLVAAHLGSWAFHAFRLESWLAGKVLPDASEGPTPEYEAQRELFESISRVVRESYFVTLTLATLIVPVAWLLRMLLRAQTRAGYADRFEGLRNATKNQRHVTTALLLAPIAFWHATRLLYFYEHEPEDFLYRYVAPALVVAGAQAALVIRGWRALIAPLLDESQTGEAARSADGFTFQAVAVTRETQATVGGLAVVSLAMFASSYWLAVSTLVHNPIFIGALLAYLVTMIGVTTFFVRASRIRVGLDGVYISGSARRRFVPFSEVDNVRVEGVNLDLRRGSRRALRLQLHGEDALRRDALAERLRAAIALAEQHRDEPAVAFVKRADVASIKRAADGAASYREVAPTREKLWEMLESPAVDARGRAAAATALAGGRSPEDEARLRRAGERCAEPAVRARIAELLEDDEDDREEEPKLAARALR